MSHETQHTYSCPKCKKANIRRSSRTLVDRLYAILGQNPYRCRDCRTRFRATALPLGKTEARLESRKRRLALRRREFYVYAVATFAFAAIVLFLSTERG